MWISKLLLRITLGALSLPAPLWAKPAHSGAFVPAFKTNSLASDVLDLNTATPAQLAALPGMGAAYAKRVVGGRPYSAKNQLVTRGVLPAEAYEQIKNRIVAHRPPKP